MIKSDLFVQLDYPRSNTPYDLIDGAKSLQAYDTSVVARIQRNLLCDY